MESAQAEGMAPVHPRKLRRLRRKCAFELNLEQKEEWSLQRQRKKDRRGKEARESQTLSEECQAAGRGFQRVTVVCRAEWSGAGEAGRDTGLVPWKHGHVPMWRCQKGEGCSRKGCK